MRNFCFIFFTTWILINENFVLSSKDPLVAFQCGRPAYIYKNENWILDFQQDCVHTDAEVVKFCQKSFPLLKVLTAEPAIQKIAFKKWCDFNNENCNVDLDIRPFKCLDKTFQSDALILPRNCQFGHVLNKDECVNYKILAQRAREECLKKIDWSLKSYGMLFPCGKSTGNISPMHFKGVEFVCCPKVDVKEKESDGAYRTYLNNAVLDSEKGEQRNYEDSEKRLVDMEKEKKAKAINNFKNAEKNLNSIWLNDPEYASKKEKKIIDEFTVVYNAIQDQFLNNKEQLLNYHDDRLEFLFNTKYLAAKRRLKELLKKSEKSETEVFEAMRSVLDLLLNRKKSLFNEYEEAIKIRAGSSDQLREKILSIEKNINKLFDSLDEVPQLKSVIRDKLMNYITNSYSVANNPTENKKSIYDDDNKDDLKDIIAKYKHRPDDNSKKFENVDIHYDLGLNDNDQTGSFGRRDGNFYKENENFEGMNSKRGLLGIIFGSLTALSIVLILGFGYFYFQRKKRLSGYSHPKLHKDDHRIVSQGFGIYDHQNISKCKQPHGIENFSYMSVTRLENPVEVSETEAIIDPETK